MSAEHSEQVHTPAGKYVQVAVVLFVLTALEVLLYELCYGGISHSVVGLSASVEPWFVELLLGLSFLKFWYVAMFYMHLKSDSKILSGIFGFSLVIAFIVIVALIALFVYNRGLWWATGKW
ncbi:MAG TPA: cytochrome C oxidase subunit IV family protein [Gemmatimonadales bacterium]|nr:cytochrome C oxidase subunit IV family protein [Gemmatimonadales bacterium]